MHNIRPADQMWPAEAFNLARKVSSASLLDRNTIEWVKNDNSGSRIFKKFEIDIKFELYTLDLAEPAQSR